ncbi:hypothetical protein DLM75_16810 [Leptospira stimsonii]|uniref:Uncharacterized protein n=1 Tax=Leptospira stimsonii TaxID=2202203 RepID=A0A396Z0K4_9LEPT|nr:hypothetical protein DLM75_16810 [Leptospira stimsonii]
MRRFVNPIPVFFRNSNCFKSTFSKNSSKKNRISPFENVFLKKCEFLLFQFFLILRRIGPCAGILRVSRNSFREIGRHNHKREEDNLKNHQGIP